MAYMLLILEGHDDRKKRGRDEGRVAYDSMMRFAGDLSARGLLKGANALRSDAQGVRVAVRDGRQSIVDGPFAESKEMVGGFFLLDCATREEAIAIAQACPAAKWATVEVREV
ncbi:MAG TPA: YciI family protein, partial [Micropepsaceae bacterium]